MAQEPYSLRSAGGLLILLTAILTSGASFFAGGAIPIAPPRIQLEFNTALSGIQWVVNANLLTLSALILIGGGLVTCNIFFPGSPCSAGINNGVSRVAGLLAVAVCSGLAFVAAVISSVFINRRIMVSKESDVATQYGHRDPGVSTIGSGQRAKGNIT